MIPSAPVAAVTGALQWIERDTFLEHPFNSEYEVNGEDVELCLDVQEHLGQQVWLCTEASAIHNAETTRSQDPLQAGNSVDELRLRARTRQFLEHAPENSCEVLLQQQQLSRNPNCSRDELDQEFGNAKQLRQRLEEQETVLLSLREERLAICAISWTR